MSDPGQWTTPAQVVAAVRRRWTDGSLLRAVAGGEEFPQIHVPIRGPSSVDLADHYDVAVTWADSLRRESREGRAFDLRSTRVGGRLAGRSDVPSRAVVSTFDQAWRVLGVAEEVSSFRTLVGQSAAEPAALAWALRRPLSAVALAAEWSALLAATRWLDDHRGSGMYLRQVAAPGVDTKLIERHRAVLANWLGVPSDAAEFLATLGLARKPQLVRLRPDSALHLLPDGSSEGVLRAEEVGDRTIRPSVVLIIENEITYLAVPVPPGGVVIWGRGFDLDPLRRIAWLSDARVVYWGDIDTHGFAILDRLRAFLPHASSVLMDRETLQLHEPRWGTEPAPTTAALSRLTPDESVLYADLVSDVLGESLRLEQERIDWGWAEQLLVRTISSTC